MKPVAERIKEFNESFLEKSRKIKYERMSENLFRFFRGTCHLFYEDLGKEDGLPGSPLAWISGDLHIENFGSYKSNNRLVYFDMNDFGEAILAPAAWEIVRMITSIFIAFESEPLEISEKKAEKMAALFLEIYSITLQKGKALYIEPQVAKGIVRTFLENISMRPQMELLNDRTFKKKNKLRLKIEKDHQLMLDESLEKELQDHFTQWAAKNNRLSRYHCIDVVFRIAGTGGIGGRRYCFLLQGLKNPDNYVLLDMKEATASSLMPYTTIQQPNWQNEAERICTVQEYMQNAGPGLLSKTSFQNADYVIRELQPSEDKINFELIKKRFKDIEQVIADMAVLTASAQLRSSGRKNSATADDLIAFGNEPGWQNKIIDFSKTYSNVIKQYYKIYLQQYKEGYFQ